MQLNLFAIFALLGLFAAGCGNGPSTQPPPDPRSVRCAVIGGMTMTGLWPEIVKMFEAETGYRCELAATGPRPEISEVLRAGKADLLTMHSGDITTDLVADGYGINMRPWTRNELSIVGPTSDPAGIRGMTNGAAALRKIADARARFVDFQGVGSREMAHNLWRASGVEPKGDWVLKDETVSKFDILQFARSNHAYVIVGYIPARLGKMNPAGMEILVQGDPAMRRPFVVMEANPKRFPQANTAGAHALADFLLSPKVQSFLAEFGQKTTGRGPLFHPVQTAVEQR
jgi:tungstate transport system substrate-binding protein